MTQHPFDREFSEQEAAKLNAEQEPTDIEQELTDEEADRVAGGSKDITLPRETPYGEQGGSFPLPSITKPVTGTFSGEGGGTSNVLLEAG